MFVIIEKSTNKCVYAKSGVCVWDSLGGAKTAFCRYIGSNRIKINESAKQILGSGGKRSDIYGKHYLRNSLVIIMKQFQLMN